MTAVCAGAPADPAITVSGPVRLLDHLQQARWQPGLINLNNPAIDVQPAAGSAGERMLLAHPPSALSWSLDLRAPVRLRTALAVDEAGWRQGGDGVVFEVRLAGRRSPLLRRHIQPRRLEPDRGWTPVEIDLSGWAGERITLTLLTDPGPAADPAWDWARWLEPRLEAADSTPADTHDGGPAPGAQAPAAAGGAPVGAGPAPALP